MKQIIRTLLACCREAPAEGPDPQPSSPQKAQDEPVEEPPREDSPEPEVGSVSLPAAVLEDGGDGEPPAEDLKAVEVSAEEALVLEAPTETKKKREKKSRKKDPSQFQAQKKPSFKSRSSISKERDAPKEGFHKPLPASAKPLKSILKKR